jgi:DNA-binding IclR family transcriptional regulator
LGRAAAAAYPLADAARPTLERLRDETGESVQLFVRSGAARLCVESLESAHGLRWIVPVGEVLPLDRGSAGRVLSGVGGSVVESVEEREAGVASVSAAIHDRGGAVVAAVCVSGPVERLTRAPARRYGDAVLAAASAIEAATSDSARGRHTPGAWTT